MLDEPFNKYFMCNFSDAVVPADIPNKRLRELWCGETSSKQRLEHIFCKWQEKHQLTDANQEDVDDYFCNVIDLVMLFLQYNFTGPFTQLDEVREFLEEQPLGKNCDACKKLMVNGEELNPNVKLAKLFVRGKEMLEELKTRCPKSLYLRWWHLRVICIHQQIIDELTSSLYEQFKIAADGLLKDVLALEDNDLQALLYLELANGYLLFHRSQKSDEILSELCQHQKIVLNVEGLLGLRTKFQQKALPQLCLKVERSDSNTSPSSAHTNGKTKIPKLLLLDDDTRLERIRFIEPKDNEVMALPTVLQALVLSKVRQLKRSQPKDRLADEELEPYIQTLLYQEFGALQVRQSALLLNCSQESSQRRTVERSWKQCEEAVKVLKDTNYSVQERLSYGFASFLQPMWHVQLQLCELLVSLGMTKTALDIYLQIQAWEQVIECYTRLELRQKAEEIIRQELAKKPTVLLYCMLGDATDDPTCYATAWDFSKQTSGKAQAHWGNYYFRRREYEQALPHLEKSVNINPLQEKIWLRLGYAAITLERWELAVHAYITYTHLEPLGFESWNNLAKALIKLGDKKRAHKLLSESLKCNYTNWKVWENFMVVSVDTCNFEDSINAYNRLSELKEQFIDLEVLCILVNAIAQQTPDAKGQTNERLLKKLTTLLGHQCVKHSKEPKVWELAAQLAPTTLKKAEKLVKAYRMHTTKENCWSTKQPVSLKTLQLCRDLCQFSLEACSNCADGESAAMITSQLHSARLVAQGCISAVEKAVEKWEQNQELLAEVKELHEKVSQILKERMGAAAT